MSYEKPTDELRQVKRAIKRSNGVLGPGHWQETLGYDTTIQRKWLVYDGDTQIYGPLVVWSASNPEEPKPREEWRDLETVWLDKPQATAQ